MIWLLFMAIVSHLMTPTRFSYCGSSSHKIIPFPTLCIALLGISNWSWYLFLALTESLVPFFHLLKFWQLQNHVQLMLFWNLIAINMYQNQVVQLFLVGIILFLHRFFLSGWIEMMGTSCSISKLYLTVNDLNLYPNIGPTVLYYTVKRIV